MKLNSKILKIKLFYLKYSGIIKKNKGSLDFSSISKSEVNNILFIFPIKEETYRVASYVFRDLIINSDSSHYFIINRIFYSTFAKKGNLYGMNYFKSKDKIIFDDKIEHDGIFKKKI